MFIEQETKFEDVEKWTKNIPLEGILQVLTDIANDLIQQKHLQGM